MQLTTIVLRISSFFWLLVVITDTATLNIPRSANCRDQAKLMCTSENCNNGYTFFRNGSIIYTNLGPPPNIDKARYSAIIISDTQVQLTVTDIQLSDNGSYTCKCGFDNLSAGQTLQYECKATTCSAEVTSAKKLSITVDELYPQPSGTSGTSVIVTALTSPISQLPGTYSCVPSPTLTSHFMCIWVSRTSLLDGSYGYTITITTGTQTARLTGSFRIVTATSPTISNLMPISNNRQVIRGIQDTPLTIRCMSKGGIPAPTLAWYRGSTNKLHVAQSNTSNLVQQSDGTYAVNLSYSFIPRRTDDMTTFLCQLFYPEATTDASSDPSSVSALLYLDLKPDIVTVSQTGEAISERNMTLQCTSTNGRPAPVITWSYRGQIFTPTNTLSLDSDETYTVVSVLKRPVSAVDNGQMATCTISHTTLPASLNATATVDVMFGPMPESTTISGNKTTPATGTDMIRLNCTSGSSNPASNITWYNGSDVISNTEHYIRWHGNNNGVISSNILTITPTRYMDGDRITCRSHNGYGHGSAYVDLDILYSCLIQTLPNVTAIEGEPDVTLTCSASSKPPANFTWYKGNMVVAIGMGSFTNTFSYVIPRVDRNYSGRYRCHASNNVGHPDSRDAYLIVKYPPTVTLSAAASSPYTIACTADGYPDSYKYQDWVQIWPGYGPVATIPFSRTLTLTNDTYARSGIYVCGVSNGVAVYGTDQTYMHGNKTVIIEAPPVLLNPWPSGLRVRVAGRIGQDASTNFKYWSNVNDSVVRCNKLGASRSSSSGCNVTETETEVALPVLNHTVTETGKMATIKIPIRSLEDFTAYDIVVTNHQGKSVLGITIVPEGPPAVPTITDIIAVKPGQVILTVVPGFHGGYNQTLVVQISSNNATWIDNKSVYIGMDTQPVEVILVNLKGNALYYLKMFSFNIVGRSNSSSEILNITTTEDASSLTPPTAALIWGTVGTTGGLSVAVVIVVVVLRKRKVGLIFSKAGDKRRLAKEQDTTDNVVECAMYVSSGNVQQGPSIRDVYSTPQKKRHSQLTGNLYNVVAKRKKDQDKVVAVTDQDPKDLYATPLKKSGGAKKGKTGKSVKGSRHVSQVSETELDHNPTSIRHQIPKKNFNDDGLIYVDLEFDSTASYDVIHGLDDVTIYVEIDFTRTAEPLPESDGESTDTK